MPRTGELESPVEEAPPKPAERRPEPPPLAGRPASRRRLMRFGLFALLIAVAVGVFWWLHSRNHESTDDAQVDGHIAPISPKVSGTIQQVLVNDNQHVVAGQVLVKLDPRDYQARVDQAKAALAVAESQAHAAQAGVPLTRATTASGTSGAAAQV
ncbi:MAG TPA: biotin/lipoyl-binding protein, partial [Bryobacteraceae bacterium]